MLPTPHILAELKQAGRRAAAAFIADHRDKIGVESSVDLERMFR